MDSTLRYVEAGQWTDIPAWAAALIQLGFTLAGNRKVQRRKICVIALPTRSYAAAFAAIGAVRYGIIPGARIGDPGAHFKSLRALKRRERVRFIHKGRSLRGMMDGPSTVSGKDAIRILVQTRQSKSYLFTEDTCHNVQIDTAAEWDLPGRQPARNVRCKPEFLQQVFGSDYSELLARSVIDVVIVGRMGLLEEEITSTLFATGDKEDPETSTLQELLRVRRLLGASEPFRSELYGTTSMEEPAIPANSIPPLVIFDGSIAFLKCRHNWRQSNWLVLLDRTEPQFEAASQEVNAEYVQKRVDDGLSLEALPVPHGLEWMEYEEKRQ